MCLFTTNQKKDYIKTETIITMENIDKYYPEYHSLKF